MVKSPEKPDLIFNRLAAGIAEMSFDVHEPLW